MISVWEFESYRHAFVLEGESKEVLMYLPHYDEFHIGTLAEYQAEYSNKLRTAVHRVFLYGEGTVKALGGWIVQSSENK